MHISDFNKMIGAIVREQPVPFIYERLGERYQHYMIDEFQDTSGLQWQNLLPLIDNSLAGGHMNLVVGDGKQAIYRFRNGDVEQFARLPQLTEGVRSEAKAEWEQSLRLNANFKTLGTNFRSGKEVIAFNNRFFSYAASNLIPALQPIYKDVEQKHLPSKSGGYVEVCFIESDGINTNDDTEFSGDFESRTLEKTKQTIDQLIGSGHHYADITILCHSNAKASLTARYLLGESVPVISSESLLLNQSEEVNFILTFLRLLADPFDQIAAIEMAACLYRKNNMHTPPTVQDFLVELKANVQQSGTSGNTLLSTMEKLLQNNHIPLGFSSLLHLNLYDICETLVRIFFADTETPNPFIAFFSDAVFEFTERYNHSVHDFLTWWDEKGSTFSLVLPEGMNAVRIMTIHKSKGLQFPVVIIPFADHRFSRTTKSGQWVDLQLPEIQELSTTWVGLGKSDLEHTPWEELQTTEAGKSYLDTLNMVYVAFTRPEEKLYIFPKKSKTFTNKTTSGLLQQFLLGEDLWHDDQLTYCFGQQHHVSGSQVFDINRKSVFQTIVSQPWQRALRMKSHQAERSHADEQDVSLERGNLLHRAMEEISKASDVDTVLEKMHMNAELDATKKEEWKQKIKRLIKQEEIAPYFTAEAKTKSEAGIFDENGNFYRPDRVVFTQNETVVIDYKTGRYYAKHQEQMKKYGELLERMGYQNIKKYLLYLDENKVKAV